jgi:hypothetical protein
LKYQTNIFKLKKNNEKRAITPRSGNQIYLKIAGHVDLNQLNMFSVDT